MKKIQLYFKIGLTFLFLAIAGIYFSSHAKAANVTWDGGGTTNNWSEANNWNPNTVPTSADTAVFDTTSAKPLVVNAGAGDFEVGYINITTTYGGSVTQNGNMTVDHTLYLSVGTWTMTGSTPILTILGSLSQYPSTTFNANGHLTIGNSIFQDPGSVLNVSEPVNWNLSNSIFQIGGQINLVGGNVTIGNSDIQSGNGAITLAGDTTFTVLSSLLLDNSHIVTTSGANLSLTVSVPGSFSGSNLDNNSYLDFSSASTATYYTSKFVSENGYLKMPCHGEFIDYGVLIITNFDIDFGSCSSSQGKILGAFLVDSSDLKFPGDLKLGAGMQFTNGTTVENNNGTVTIVDDETLFDPDYVGAEYDIGTSSGTRIFIADGIHRTPVPIDTVGVTFYRLVIDNVVDPANAGRSMVPAEVFFATTNDVTDTFVDHTPNSTVTFWVGGGIYNIGNIDVVGQVDNLVNLQSSDSVIAARLNIMQECPIIYFSSVKNIDASPGSLLYAENSVDLQGNTNVSFEMTGCAAFLAVSQPPASTTTSSTATPSAILASELPATGPENRLPIAIFATMIIGIGIILYRRKSAIKLVKLF